MKSLLIATAAIEAGAGLALLGLPSRAAGLLLGTALDGPAALTVARVGGLGLLALGVVCWRLREDRGSDAAIGLVDAMTVYNIGATAMLAYAGVGLGLRGVILWPAVVLHAAMAAWCVGQRLRKK